MVAGIIIKSKLALLATQQANKFEDEILRQEITETGEKKAGVGGGVGGGHSLKERQSLRT